MKNCKSVIRNGEQRKKKIGRNGLSGRADHAVSRTLRRGHRKNEAGTREYFPEEKLTIDQAIAAYTLGAAYAKFSEKTKAELVPGKWADLVVLDRDITEVSPEKILGTKVLRTIVGGKTVYETQ
jgi:predicted amidohydrolase YtcJ